ncbi:MAG: histidine kinase [Archangium sp.]
MNAHATPTAGSSLQRTSMSEPHVPVDDFWPRAVGIPVFGVGIPLLFDLYGSVSFPSPRWFLGQVLFLALAFAVWHGNRYLLFATADRFDWLERPWRRVGRLLLGIVLFTAPLTVAVLAAWFLLGRGEVVEGAARAAVMNVVLMNVICVVFVAHVYETVLLLKARESDLVRVAKAEQARTESELLALRRQVDPHFLFNSLNTLSALLDEDPARAKKFNESLAAMLRYLLDTSERQQVTLREELEFVGRYAELMTMRFGDAFRLEVRGDLVDARLPPTSVQLLVENAIAHNRLSQHEPLSVVVQVEASVVSVSNPLRPRPDSRGTGVGLQNLAERLRLTSGAELSIERADHFVVRIPLT